MVQHNDIDHTGITGVGGSITVEDEGTPLTTAATTLDFVGAGVTASGTGAGKTITIPGGSGLVVQDEGTPLATDATTLNFVGSGVAATGAGATKTITIAGGGGGAVYPFDTNYFNETKPGSPDATYDDEFDDTSGMSGSGNGLDARWNWRNQGGATTTFTKEGWLTLNVPSSGSQSLRIIEIAAFADGTYEAKIALEDVRSNDNGAGIALIDATNGDLYTYALTFYGSWQEIYIQRWNSVTSINADISHFQIPVTHVFLKVTKASTTLGFWWSTDGIGWQRLNSITDAVGADRIGLFGYETNSTGLTKLHCDYFRKTA